MANIPLRTLADARKPILDPGFSRHRPTSMHVRNAQVLDRKKVGLGTRTVYLDDRATVERARPPDEVVIRS